MSGGIAGVRETQCLVYQVLDGIAIGVRSIPSCSEESKTSQSFDGGEFVSVDLIQEGGDDVNSDSKNGPFLRLSDDSGWLFEHKQGARLMRPMPVQDGLWTFYVYNPGSGIALRWHPVDRKDVMIQAGGGPSEASSSSSTAISYYTSQRIYCDKMVTHPETGVNYYRVQGTRGWVFDRREGCAMLLGEEEAREGLFAYRCIRTEGIGARAFPSIEEETKTGWGAKVNDLVVADTVMDDSSLGGGTLSDSNTSGPYIHLTGGLGWMFEYKNGVKDMEEIPIEDGSWVLRVLNEVGIALRAQPIDHDGRLLETIYVHHALVRCDKRIRSPSSGVCFYRVSGTVGWVFDKRDGHTMMELLSAGTASSAIDVHHPSTGVENGWSPDFVRGIAAAVDGMEEVSFNAESRVISFRSTDDVRINVYYTTRTVGTALLHPSQGKTQLFRRDCDPSELRAIFANPRLHTDKGYQRKRKVSHEGYSIGTVRAAPIRSYRIGVVRTVPVASNEYIVDIEDELRQQLCEGEKELNEMKAKQAKLRERIAGFSAERQRDADIIRNETLAHMRAIDEKAEAVKRQELAIVEAARRKACICPICDREFASGVAMNQHKRDSHPFTCEHCFRSFNNNHGLNQHRTALGHW